MQNSLLTIQGGGDSGCSPHHQFPFHQSIILQHVPFISTSSSSPINNNNQINNTKKIISPLPFSFLSTIPFSQIALITLLSFTISEIFNYCNVFHDEHGLEATSKAKAFFQRYDRIEDALIDLVFIYIPKLIHGQFVGDDVNDNGGECGLFHLLTWKKRLDFMIYNLSGSSKMNDNNCDTTPSYSKTFMIKQWIHKLKMKMTSKHQFAIGSTAGMIIHGSAFFIIKLIGITYLLSEIIDNIVISTKNKNSNHDNNNHSSSNSFHYYHNDERCNHNNSNNNNHDREVKRTKHQYFFDDNNENDDGYYVYNQEEMDFILQKLNNFYYFCIHTLQFCNDKLKGLRWRVRAFIASPQDCIENILSWSSNIDNDSSDQTRREGDDSNDGIIMAGLIFGIIVGQLLFGAS